MLNEAGLQALQASRIGSFINDRYKEILSAIVHAKPENAYQAQELLISTVNRYKLDKEHIIMLQEAAFSSGYDIDSLLFVAALSIRDRVISDLGFKRN